MFYDIAHGRLGIVVPISSFGLLQIIVEFAIGILNKHMSTGYERTEDINQIFFYVLGSEEYKCVPAENKIYTIIWNVGAYGAVSEIEL
jgi:hypothetical protein